MTVNEIADLDTCVFCGEDLAFAGRTMEDVFPKWLQREYGLADQNLVLINGTTARYSQLTVPACAQCNNVHGSGADPGRALTLSL